jgi:hypothetical protein
MLEVPAADTAMGSKDSILCIEADAADAELLL